MSMVVIVGIAIVIVGVVWYMSNQGRANGATMQRITPQEYQTTYAKTDHLLIDVRTAEEFGTGHIPGAKNIALQTLPTKMATLPKDKPIILYCRSGARSSNAAQILAQAGFTQVYDMGGIMRWQQQGLPVH